jgi:hypothetical protein
MKAVARFVQAAGTIGAGSVALAIVLFGVSIYEHLRNKNLPAYWLLFTAAVFFSFGAYRAWATEHDALSCEREKNAKPLLKIELAGALFDVFRVPHRNEIQVRVLAYLKLTNLNSPETLIRDGTLVMAVDGTRHKGIGDDDSVNGNAIEHVSAFRIGGEIKSPDVFGNTLSPFPRLQESVNAEKPLRRGITREGFFTFTFPNLKDWNREDPEHPYTMRVTDAVFTLSDSFGGRHSLQLMFLDIPQGTVTTVGRPPVKSAFSGQVGAQ